MRFQRQQRLGSYFAPSFESNEIAIDIDRKIKSKRLLEVIKKLKIAKSRAQIEVESDEKGTKKKPKAKKGRKPKAKDDVAEVELDSNSNGNDESNEIVSISESPIGKLRKRIHNKEIQGKRNEMEDFQSAEIPSLEMNWKDRLRRKQVLSVNDSESDKDQ
jgi:hypothetical protein